MSSYDLNDYDDSKLCWTDADLADSVNTAEQRGYHQAIADIQRTLGKAKLMAFQDFIDQEEDTRKQKLYKTRYFGIYDGITRAIKIVTQLEQWRNATEDSTTQTQQEDRQDIPRRAHPAGQATTKRPTTMPTIPQPDRE